ncbi:MAG: sugar nucleotide-binding protein, partial [Candidatus Omnitrophota bacterium]
MKILVTGGKGMLGNAIKDAFIAHELILTGSIELDVRNIKQVMAYANKKPDLIIHAAAETDHVAAEFDPVACYMSNFTGTQNMVELAKWLSIPIVYISTCGIFDGTKEFYTENDVPTPLNHYGRSKYYGELAVRAYHKHYIFRCGWGMGGGPGIDKKFINKIFQLIKSGQKEIFGICDVYGSPTYHPDLARTIREIITWDYE